MKSLDWLRASLRLLLGLAMLSVTLLGSASLSWAQPDSVQVLPVGADGSEALGYARRGRLDLTAWNPSLQKSLPLNGEWAFYWNQLLTPTDLASMNPPPSAYFTVPGSWDGFDMGGHKLPDHGAASFRLLIDLPATEAPLAVQIPYIWTSYKVYVDARLEAQSGQPALTAEATRSSSFKSFIPLPEGAKQVTLLIQVADFASGTPGLLETPLIGTRTYLLAERDFRNAVNQAILGALFILAVYHLFFFFFRRRERAMLAFAVICLLVLVRFAVFGDHYLFDWLLQYSGLLTFSEQARLYYAATFLLGVAGLYYLSELYPADVWKRAPRLALFVGIAVLLFALVTPLNAFISLLPVVLGVLVVIVVYSVYIILRAAWLGRSESRLLLLGLGGMILAGIHDALAVLEIYLFSETELLTYGFLFFVFVQFVVVARRFSTTFAAVEDLSANLERKVEQRTAELAAANLEIREKNQDITDSIEYAKRIQLSILPDQALLSDRLPDSFVHYAPKDIVSGDFYWFHTKEDGTLTAVVADATGHGVPGAFMSVLGINLLSRAMHEAPDLDPAELLKLLHGWVQQALKQNTLRTREEKSEDGMEMALVQLLPTGQLRYAGANRPLLRVRNGSLDEIAPAKHPIGGSESHLGTTADFKTHVIEPDAGDVYYLFTDGATDQFGGDGETRRRFSGKRFRSLLQEIAVLKATEQGERISQALRDWQGESTQTDDILVLGFRISDRPLVTPQ